MILKIKTKTMEKKKFKKLVDRMAQDINSGVLDISWMFEDDKNKTERKYGHN